MWYLGIDIGSAYSKTALCEGTELRSFAVLPSGGNYEEIGRRLVELVLEQTEISFKDVSRTVATGYGSMAISYADDTVSDIVCHAAGLHHLYPTVRTAVDVGAQFSKAIRINDDGKVVQFVMNEKCAGGSGKFLQVMARMLQRTVEDVAEIVTSVWKPVEFTTGCAVFAESEAVSRIAEGAAPEEILAGVHKAMASKISNLVTRVGLTPECALTGGGAKHRGLVEAVEWELGLAVHVAPEPRITAALGAALLASRSRAHSTSRETPASGHEYPVTV
jgi:(R)-2-hydroxyacyl-CoA dehydratese activating ATPase